jgi:ankyrin repeat protein
VQLNIKDIIDIKGNSLLHHAAINNNACVFSEIVTAFKR